MVVVIDVCDVDTTRDAVAQVHHQPDALKDLADPAGHHLLLFDVLRG